MTFAVWQVYFIACWLIAISPGSGAVLSMAHGMNYGVRGASITIMGLQAGLILTMFISVVGLGTLIASSPTWLTVIKVVGACYLIYLGVKQCASRATPMIHNDGTIRQTQVSFFKRFLTGFFTNTTNPKGLLFMMAVTPGFINPHASIWPQFMIMAITMSTVDIIVMHGYAFGAKLINQTFKSERALKLQHLFFGGLLILVGVALVFYQPPAMPV